MATPNAGVDQTGPQQVAPSLPSWNTETQQGDVRIRISWRHTQNGAVTIKVGRQGKFKQADKPKPTRAPRYTTQKCMRTNSFKHTDKNTEAQILPLNAVIQVSDWILPPCQPPRVTSEQQSNTQVHKHTYTVMQTRTHPPASPN